MNLAESRKYDLLHPSISCMCPKCYGIKHIGSISCTINVEADTQVMHLPQTLTFNAPALLTYPVPGKQRLDNVSLIQCICPECHIPMIAVDTEIVYFISALNKCGFYTENSCAGHDDWVRGPDRPYIHFFYQAPDALLDTIKGFLNRLEIEMSVTEDQKTAFRIFRPKVANRDNGMVVFLHKPMIKPFVNLLLDPKCPGAEEYKKINAEFGVKTLYDLLELNEE